MKIKSVKPLPSQIELISHIGKLFGNRPAQSRHMRAIIQAADIILAEFRRESVAATPAIGLDAWRQTDDTAASSVYMANVMSGLSNTQAFAHPHDPDDFGRCYRLLRSVPEFADKLEALSTCPAPWPDLIVNWSELEGLYEEELANGRAPKLYSRMRSIIDGAKVSH